MSQEKLDIDSSHNNNNDFYNSQTSIRSNMTDFSTRLNTESLTHVIADECAPPETTRPEPRDSSRGVTRSASAAAAYSPSALAAIHLSPRKAQPSSNFRAVMREQYEERRAFRDSQDAMMRMTMERSFSEIGANPSNLSVKSMSSNPGSTENDFQASFAQLVQAEADRTETVLETPHSPLVKTSSMSSSKLRLVQPPQNRLAVVGEYPNYPSAVPLTAASVNATSSLRQLESRQKPRSLRRTQSSRRGGTLNRYTVPKRTISSDGSSTFGFPAMETQLTQHALDVGANLGNRIPGIVPTDSVSHVSTTRRTRSNSSTAPEGSLSPGSLTSSPQSRSTRSLALNQQSQLIRLGPLPKTLISNRALHTDAGAAAVLEVARRTLAATQVELIEQALIKGGISSATANNRIMSTHSKRSTNTNPTCAGTITVSTSDHSRRTNPQQHSDSSFYQDELSTGSQHTVNTSSRSIGRPSSRNSFEGTDVVSNSNDLNSDTAGLTLADLQEFEHPRDDQNESNSRLHDVSTFHNTTLESIPVTVSPWSSSPRPAAFIRTPPSTSPKISRSTMTPPFSSYRQPDPIPEAAPAVINVTNSLESTYDLSGAEENLSAEELEQIRQALAESSEEYGSHNPAMVTLGVSSNPDVEANQNSTEMPSSSDPAAHLSLEEASAIEKALREADYAEELKSIQLAMQMQAEDVMQHRQQQQQQQPNTYQRQQQQQGNIRVMTRDAYQAEMRETGSGPVENFYNTNGPPPMTQHVDDSDFPEPVAAAGFRMNSVAHRASGQPWSRRDQHCVVGPNNEVRTKHDPRLDSLANAHRLGLDADDDVDPSGIDDSSSSYVNHIHSARIGNKAYNSFVQSVNKKTSKKGVASHGTGRAGSDVDATKGGAMDPKVRQEIAKAINGGLIDKCNGVVKEGKEAIVYHADKGEESGGFDVAVKVFKRIQEFKGRADYVDGDPRYSKVSSRRAAAREQMEIWTETDDQDEFIGDPRNRDGFRQSRAREQLELWAEKEYRNLLRAIRAGVPVPTPLLQKQNILFMRFLGVDGWPAPQLREVDLRSGSAQWTILYKQVMNAVRKLYLDARLVHGDLSEYNIMVVPVFLLEDNSDSVSRETEDMQAVLIDFGQTVDVRHPESNTLLERDLKRVETFFKRNEVQTLEMSDAISFVTDENSQIIL